MYNPFERSSESEEKALKAFDKTNFAFVPVRLRLLSSSGGGSLECLYHYENVKVLRKGEISTGGEWVPGDYDPGKDPTGESMWLAYYDNGDREKKPHSAVGLQTATAFPPTPASSPKYGASAATGSSYSRLLRQDGWSSPSWAGCIPVSGMYGILLIYRV